MVADAPLVAEKLEQARGLMDELGIDLWVTYCRETSQIGEPVVPLILGYDIVMPTVLLVARDGRSMVITGVHDAPLARELDAYDEVVGYAFDTPIEDDLRAFLADVDPDRIALNYAEELHAHIADGLTHGLYRRLRSMLDGSGYEDRLESAYELVAALRGIKSPIERERMRRAGELTQDLLAETFERWDPTWSEADIESYLHGRMREEGLGGAWSMEYCPGINTGPDVEIGRTLAGDRRLDRNELLHIDFGVNYDGYATDMQRVYYRPDGGGIPPGLTEAFRDARAAIRAAKDALEPGVPGYTVDAASRGALTDRGWPEPDYGVGHNVGRNAHDGGTLLGPRWHHFGAAVEREVREGEIYALELGMQTEWGFLGQEEVVEVTADGAEYFVEPQTRLRTLPREA